VYSGDSAPCDTLVLYGELLEPYIGMIKSRAKEDSICTGVYCVKEIENSITSL